MSNPEQNKYDSLCREDNLYPKGTPKLQTIQVDKIKGSAHRHEFDHGFSPDHADQKKLFAILNAIKEGIILPPISVFKIDEDYYVDDGNHRVVTAKKNHQIDIDAYVTELLPSGDCQKHLLWRAKSKFEWETEFTIQTGYTLHFTRIYSYRRTKEYIQLWARQITKDDDTEISLEEEAKRWYNEVYQPLSEQLKSNKVIKHFPGFTLDDLCLHVIHRQANKSRRQKRMIDLKEEANTFCLQNNRRVKGHKIIYILGFIIAKKRHQSKRRTKQQIYNYN
jgi:hypothetical protein